MIRPPLPPHANPDAALLTCCEEAEERVLELTERLVNMDSGTDDLPGLERKAHVLADIFRSLGANSVELREAPEPRRGTYNVVAVFKGTGRARVLMLTHYDTVFPAGEAARRPFRREGDMAYGPGVADMQSSIALLIAAVEILHNKLGQRNYDTLTIHCNADEETGSYGSRALIRELGRSHHVSYNMEQSGREGELITISGRGIAKGTLAVTGIASHAGGGPEKGRNAGYELAHQLLQLRDLSRPEIRTGVHWTMGSFGHKLNVIPDHAEAFADVRVTRVDEFDRIRATIEERIKNRLIPDCRVEFDMDISVLPFQNDPVTLSLAEKVVAFTERELGRRLGFRHANGGNDTSHCAQVCPSLDGFGLGCLDNHSPNEALPLATIGPRLYILLRTWQETFAGRMLNLGEQDSPR